MPRLCIHAHTCKGRESQDETRLKGASVALRRLALYFQRRVQSVSYCVHTPARIEIRALCVSRGCAHHSLQACSSRAFKTSEGAAAVSGWWFNSFLLTPALFNKVKVLPARAAREARAGYVLVELVCLVDVVVILLVVLFSCVLLLLLN